jgi:hypothetical protein
VPVVSLHSPSTDRLVLDRALRALVSGLAAALDCPTADVWAHHVRMDEVRQGERDVAAGGFCPVVVIRGRARTEHAIGHALAAAAGAVSQAFSVPLEDVWVQWVDVVPGRAFAGGDLV